jgi:AraC-like DNA-binding protein
VASWRNATALDRATTLRGILRPAETSARADLRRDAPVSEPLRPFVERYWSVRWDLTGRPPFRSEVLSHPSVNVSVESGTVPRFGFGMPAVLVHGVVTRRFTVDLTGTGRVTAVKFRPGGFTAFTGARPGRNTVEPLGRELGVPAERLLADVLAPEDDDERAAVLDAALVPLAPEPAGPYLDLLGLVAAMIEDRQLVRVDQVAALGGLSVRSLQRLFAGYVGVGPKWVILRYRIHEALERAESERDIDWAGLAADLGYADQAHLVRDFTATVGVPPTAYAAQGVG